MRRLFLLAAILISLSSCGKKGELKHTDEANMSYPKTYPSR
jgi:predicted small lipoprotein YifL